MENLCRGSPEQDTDRGAKDEGTEEGGVPLSMSVCALSLLLLYFIYARTALPWHGLDSDLLLCSSLSFAVGLLGHWALPSLC